ncbi:MAG: hypothetical protein FWB80_01450 [Defluviitaleaceae bacterium]|nr:hypothetical protein [Defluviitaleaceae bacterium]
MSTINISIPLDETLRCQMEDVLNEKEISISVADNMIKKIAFIITQQKRAMGLLNDTEYLLSIPGMKDILLEGMSTPLSECLDEGDLWTDV